LKQAEVVLFGLHIAVDLGHNLLILSSIEILPPLEEFNVSVPFIEVLSKEGVHIFEGPWLNHLSIGLESRNHV